MKLLTALWAISLLSFGCFAQTTDSLAIDVVYKQAAGDRDVAFMINGDFMSNTAVQTIVPGNIENLHVSKEDTVVDGKTYRGILWITLKDEYTPAFISLTNLQRKYTELQPGTTIFMIDDNLIGGSYDQLMVDEKYILKIEVNRLSDAGGREGVNVVKLLTRSEENIKKSKEFWIRGNAYTIEPTGDYSDK